MTQHVCMCIIPQAAAAAPARLRRYQVLPAAESVPVYPESVLWHQGDAHGARLLPSLPERRLLRSRDTHHGGGDTHYCAGHLLCKVIVRRVDVIY